MCERQNWSTSKLIQLVSAFFRLRHIYINIEIWSTHFSKFQCLHTYARISKKKITSLIFQAIQEKITSKQEAFDSLAERAQTLLQSTTDNRVTSQLTQLSSRYTSLIASSKVSISYVIIKDTQNLDMSEAKVCVMNNVSSILCIPGIFEFRSLSIVIMHGIHITMQQKFLSD